MAPDSVSIVTGPQREQQRLGRRLIAPVPVIHDHHDDAIAGLGIAEHRHQQGTRGQRVVGAPWAGAVPQQAIGSR
jgi:hypothetical protein